MNLKAKWVKILAGRKGLIVIQIGATYRHYKGKEYKVIALAKHSETLEDMVVYAAQYESEFPFGQVWCRPASMWNELVNGVPRFELIKEIKDTE